MKNPSAVTLTFDGKRQKEEVLAGIPDCAITPCDGTHAVPAGHNMLIHAENLHALKALAARDSIRGNVRLVYIDPPFATLREFRVGKTRTATVSSSTTDDVAYTDGLRGAEYLSHLRERLLLLYDLLADDGSLYVHIDGKIGHYVKIVLDEIFGETGFRNDIARIKCNPKNFSRRGFGNIKDVILFYTKTDAFVWNEPRMELTEADLLRLFPKVDQAGRRYTTTPLHAPGETRNGRTGEKWNHLSPPAGRHWRVPPAELAALDERGLIEWSSNGNPRKRIYAEEVREKGKKVQDVWELKDPPFPSYPTEKNADVLRRIIRASSNPGDIVLDCYCGSGTTLCAADELDRRWIGIDNAPAAIAAASRRLASHSARPFLHCMCRPLHNEDVAH